MRRKEIDLGRIDAELAQQRAFIGSMPPEVQLLADTAREDWIQQRRARLQIAGQPIGTSALTQTNQYKGLNV